MRHDEEIVKQLRRELGKPNQNSVITKVVLGRIVEVGRFFEQRPSFPAIYANQQ